MSNSSRSLWPVSVALVDENPFNARCIYDDEVVTQRAREIRADGQLVAAIAVPSSTVPGRFIVIDGHYRLRAIRAVGLKTILLDVRESVTNVELYRLSYALNEQRTAHTAFDNALAWRQLLMSNTVASQGALGAITGKSVPTISKTLQLLELPEAVLEIVRTAPVRFTLKLGYSLTLICKAGGVEQATQLAQRALIQNLPQAEVAQALRWAQSGKRCRKHRDDGRKHQIEREGLIGSIKSWDSGKVVLDLLFTEPVRSALFVEQLKHLVALPA